MPRRKGDGRAPPSKRRANAGRRTHQVTAAPTPSERDVGRRPRRNARLLTLEPLYVYIHINLKKKVLCLARIFFPSSKMSRASSQGVSMPPRARRHEDILAASFRLIAQRQRLARAHSTSGRKCSCNDCNRCAASAATATAVISHPAAVVKNAVPRRHWAHLIFSFLGSNCSPRCVTDVELVLSKASQRKVCKRSTEQAQRGGLNRSLVVVS